MRLPTSVGYVLSAAAAITLLAGCSGGSSQVAPLAGGNGVQSLSRHAPGAIVQRSTSVLPKALQRVGHPKNIKGFMTKVDAANRLTYISDGLNNIVAIFDRKGNNVGVLTGFSEPQGLVVDSPAAGRNVWIANTTANNVLEYARGGTSPINTLTDPNQYPVDVAICPNGTIYVSNIFAPSTGIGSISVYAGGSTSPTGNLMYPGQGTNYFVACDANNNVFSTGNYPGSFVVEYPGGNQTGATLLPISLSFPGGIKANNAGNIVVDDQNGHTIAEYTEAGAPTGNSINTGSGDIVDIGITYSSKVVGGADALGVNGQSWLFPAGTPRKTYTYSGFAQPIGFGFDPGKF